MRHKLHRVFALWFGGFIALWMSAGCVLLWKESLQAPTHVPPQDISILPSLTSIVAAAHSRHPEPGSWRLKLPRRPGEAVQAVFVADDLFAEAAEPIVLWIDPKTAKVLAETQASSFWQGLYRFHSRLLLGDSGSWAALGCGLILGNILLSGALLWRRRIRATGVRTLHRRLGMGLLPLLAISWISGLLLSLPAGWLSGSSPQTAPVPVTLSPSPTVDEIASWAKKRFPELSLREIALPQAEDETWELTLHRPGNFDVEPVWVKVWVDAKRNQAQIQEPSAAWQMRLRQWVYILHTGQIAGELGQIALSFAGIGFLLQATFGLILWLRRRKRLTSRPAAADHKQQIA
ncbi:MAG: PepSY domain-containing protein [Methylohalobius sp.]|nr:PepSY domain-containing protein [Methylohalobius sp.]